MSEINEATIVNNEAFISYGKVLSCKDGIIKVAGLHDVMAGEVVKFGRHQMENNSVYRYLTGSSSRLLPIFSVMDAGSTSTPDSQSHIDTVKVISKC